MRLDHIAYRVADREATARFFQDALGYRRQDEFEIDFGGGQTARCIVLEPPERASGKCGWRQERHGRSPVLGDESNPMKWVFRELLNGAMSGEESVQYHLPPEVFVSDGTPGSVVGDWVAARGGVGGVHHVAYQVDSVERTMAEWKAKGYAEFTSDEPMKCPGLTQAFTKPSVLTGVIFEFIERGDRGFCKGNVKELMLSTKGMA